MEDVSPTTTAAPEICWTSSYQSDPFEPPDNSKQFKVTFDIPRSDSIASWFPALVDSNESRSHSIASTASTSTSTAPTSRDSWSSQAGESKQLGAIRIDTYTESHYSPISSRAQSFAIIPNSPAPFSGYSAPMKEGQPLHGILKKPQAFSHESLSPKISPSFLNASSDPDHVQSETSKGKQPMRESGDDLPENESPVPNLWEIPIDNTWGPGFRLVSLQLGSLLWEARFHHPKFGHFYAGDNANPLQNPEVLAILLDQRDIHMWRKVDPQIRHLCQVYWKNAPPIRYWVKGTTASRD
ncbi:MAG: hypothetical protein Q9187_004533 [Circinaria calcarea]